MDQVNVIGGLFKDNDKDFMLVDQNDIIVGAGSKYLDLLGTILVGLPLNLICMQAANIRKWAMQDQKLKYKSIFYSTKGC